VEWLNHKLPPLVYELPITRRGEDGTPARTWTDYANAQRLERLRARDAKQAERSEARGAVTLAVVQTAIEQTPDTFYQQMAAMLDDAGRAVAAAEAELDGHCGTAGAGLAQVRLAIEALRGFARSTLEERGAPEMPEPPAAEPVAEPAEDPHEGLVLMPQPVAAEGTAASTSAGIVIRNREDAYRVLAEIADYLHRTEPHSPTPYLIQRAVTWGSMPLHLLLMELSAGRQDLSLLFELLGITETPASTKRREIPRAG
jgi:type VI secretion system ImpA family protein